MAREEDEYLVGGKGKWERILDQNPTQKYSSMFRGSEWLSPVSSSEDIEDRQALVA